jgi:hypothetical protein
MSEERKAGAFAARRARHGLATSSLAFASLTSLCREVQPSDLPRPPELVAKEQQ